VTRFVSIFGALHWHDFSYSNLQCRQISKVIAGRQQRNPRVLQKSLQQQTEINFHKFNFDVYKAVTLKVAKTRAHESLNYVFNSKLCSHFSLEL